MVTDFNGREDTDRKFLRNPNLNEIKNVHTISLYFGLTESLTTL